MAGLGGDAEGGEEGVDGGARERRRRTRVWVAGLGGGAEGGEEGVDGGGVGEGGGVAEGRRVRLPRRDLAQDAAHDLARPVRIYACMYI